VDVWLEYYNNERPHTGKHLLPEIRNAVKMEISVQ
jgi:hypothetical protein